MGEGSGEGGKRLVEVVRSKREIDEGRGEGDGLVEVVVEQKVSEKRGKVHMTIEDTTKREVGEGGREVGKRLIEIREGEMREGREKREVVDPFLHREVGEVGEEDKWLFGDG